MNFQEYVTFANQNPVCYIATTDGAQPRVRPVLLWFADDKGFYFQTQTVKAFCKQLTNNEKVEVCFHAPGPDSTPGKAMRVTGEVEFLDDLALKSRCIEERVFLCMGNPFLHRWCIVRNSFQKVLSNDNKSNSSGSNIFLSTCINHSKFFRIDYFIKNM